MKPLTLSIIFALSFSIPAEAQTRAKKRQAPSAQPSTPIQIAEADSSRLPSRYTGHDPVSIFLALRQRRAQLRKSSFETTPDYEARVSKVVSSIPGAGSRLTFLLPSVDVTYDADASRFTIKAETGSVYPSTVYAPALGDSRGFSSLYRVGSSRTLGTAVGQNAFGVRRRFKITSRTALHLAIPSSAASVLSRGLVLEATPSTARVMYPRIRLALTGRLIPPYGAEDSSFDSATITDPEESHNFDFYLYFDPEAVIAYDISTGEVYGTLDLTEALEPRSQYAYSSSPFRLEDPLTMAERFAARRKAQAQRAEEQARGVEELKREYPPEHVFTTREVTKKAVIISRPEPIVTEEARKNQITGTVTLRMVLNSNGTVTNIVALSRLPDGLTEQAMEAARRIKFIPAERNGRPVSQYATIQYNFNVY